MILFKGKIDFFFLFIGFLAFPIIEYYAFYFLNVVKCEQSVMCKYLKYKRKELTL